MATPNDMPRNSIPVRPRPVPQYMTQSRAAGIPQDKMKEIEDGVFAIFIEEFEKAKAVLEAKIADLETRISALESAQPGESRSRTWLRDKVATFVNTMPVGFEMNPGTVAGNIDENPASVAGVLRKLAEDEIIGITKEDGKHPYYFRLT